ncbi:MAG: response regulator, partial [Chloroflexota bacterium]
AEAALPLEPASLPELRSSRVLVVEDNASHRRSIVQLLKAWGLTPFEVGSASGALALIRDSYGASPTCSPFSVVILDLFMPDLSGVALAGEIRQIEHAQELPLVLMVPLFVHDCERELYAEDTLRRVSISATVNKPIKASQLYDTLLGILVKDARPAGVLEKPAMKKFDPTMGQRYPLRILLAEDNATNQKLALRMLELLGYRADLAANGVEVLQAIRRQPYEVILMDVQMPEMDGLEATGIIASETPPGDRPYIIAMTANAMNEDREACLAAGMDDYLSKPIRVDEIISALKKSWQARSSRGMNIVHQIQTTLDPETINRLLEIEAGDKTFLAGLIQTFLADAPNLIQQMQGAVRLGDAQALARAAHSLKSGSASLGGYRLSSCCQELEGIGKSGHLEGAGEKVAEVEAELSALQPLLQTYL